MNSYQNLSKIKESGGKLDFSTITKEELHQLSIEGGLVDSEIASLYDVSKNQVAYKRKKLNIKVMGHRVLNTYLETNYQNDVSLIDMSKIAQISKAITHFAFRNGPVEKMHGNNQLSQDDMQILNKYMVNRMAYVLDLTINQKWTELDCLVDAYKHYGTDWDKVVPDDGGNKATFEEYMNNNGKE